MLKFLAGKKTHIAAGIMALSAVAAWWAEVIDGATAWQRVIEAAGLVGLRLAVKKAER